MGRDVLLGVDLIEFKKAERFYKTHRYGLSKFLSRGEISRVRQDREPHKSLAEILAAKEAVFKALRLPWMGRSGFRDIRIVPRKDGGFSFKLAGSLKKASPKRTGVRIQSLRNARYVVVKCVPCAGT